MKYLVIALALAACDPLPIDGISVDGQHETYHVFQQPLCLFWCSNIITSTGSVTNTEGGSPSTTLSPSTTTSSTRTTN